MKLLDAHAHTNLSYCAARDLTIAVYQAALDDPRSLLGRQALTNHGFQAYFPENLAWSWAFLDRPELFDEYEERGNDVLLSFRDELMSLADDRFLFGVEVELMGDGRLTVSPSVRETADLVVGSLHVLPRAYDRGSAPGDLYAAFFDYYRDLLATGVDVLAHPLRWLEGEGRIVAPEAIKELVALVAEYGAAVELNLRGDHLSVLTLIRETAAAGVPLALATDAHSVAEVGRLEEHLRLIRLAGCDPEEITIFNGHTQSPRPPFA